MKILFLTPDLKRFGGIQRYNRKLLDLLTERYENVLVLERKEGFFDKLKFAASFFLESFRYRPDVVLCGHVRFSPLVLLLSLLCTQRFFVFTHGVDVWDVTSMWQQHALRRAKAIVTVSRYTKEKIAKQLPDITERIVIIPNCVDGTLFSIKEKPKYLAERHHVSNGKVLLTVSRLSKAEKGFKGYDRVIECLPKVLQVMPGVKYLLVGDGDDRPRVLKLIHDLKLEENVVLVGNVSGEALVDYYNLADVFVMPSKCEGFGIVFLEALACGTPVIAGNADASPETLLNGALGLLVDPEDRGEITKAIINILTKKAPAQLFDRDYLRREVLKHYGKEEFRNKAEIFLTDFLPL